MIDPDEKTLPVIGAFWLDEADYPAAIRLFEDGHKLPRTWQEWRRVAEEMEQGLKSYGHVVERVRIQPEPFAAWCEAHGTTPGRQGRKLFVAAAVEEKYGKQ